MAKIKFKIRGNSDKETNIFIRYYSGKEFDISLKTGLTIHPSLWNKDQGFPINKKGSETAKYVRANLTKLDAYIQNKFILSSAENTKIDKNWLEAQIASCYGKETQAEKERDNSLKTHIRHIIDTAKTRKIKGRNKIGLAERTIKGYNTFLGLVENYEEYLGKQIDLKDINKLFVTSFTNWLLSEKGYSINYAGKNIDKLKTVCTDADSVEKKVNQYYKHIDSFSLPKEDKIVITLSFDELDKIKNTILKEEYLINSRKWLLLGCEIGQRQGDLLKITKEDFRIENGNYLVDIRQQKGDKRITAIVKNPFVIDFIENEFPRKISIQKFNSYLKELCKACEINTPTTASKTIISEDTNILTGEVEKIRRLEKGIYPKHELITSHICRRSFATNYYKRVPTAILMGLTGHSKEATFLEYIGKEKDQDENALMFVEFYDQIHNNKKAPLKVSKKKIG